MSSSVSAFKFPHPTRMVYEALRRRRDLKTTSHELYQEIHRLYPSRRSAPGERMEVKTENGIPTAAKAGPQKDYPDHPISSHSVLKAKLLPYLARSNLIQKYSYGSTSDGKRSKPNFSWRFNPNLPAPPLLPRDTPLPAPLPPTAESTPDQLIDVDGLIAMPPQWDSTRLVTTRSPPEQLAFDVGEWQKQRGHFPKNPVVHHNWDLSKRPPLPFKEAMAKELKTAVGIQLNKRKQRNRIGKFLKFQAWRDNIEQQWAERGPEMIVEQMAIDKLKTEERMIEEEARERRIANGTEKARVLYIGQN